MSRLESIDERFAGPPGDRQLPPGGLKDARTRSVRFLCLGFSPLPELAAAYRSRVRDEDAGSRWKNLSKIFHRHCACLTGRLMIPIPFIPRPISNVSLCHDIDLPHVRLTLRTHRYLLSTSALPVVTCSSSIYTHNLLRRHCIAAVLCPHPAVAISLYPPPSHCTHAKLSLDTVITRHILLEKRHGACEEVGLRRASSSVGGLACLGPDPTRDPMGARNMSPRAGACSFDPVLPQRQPFSHLPIVLCPSSPLCLRLSQEGYCHVHGYVVSRIQVLRTPSNVALPSSTNERRQDSNCEMILNDSKVIVSDHL